ncbi:hypothetical protein PPERSA_08479 [Pseudocohnilembus persalinus]|uniref:Uncharacterized protein n=1 Tax=Pseudocohnilembus persalinus TaxID=266149 RepID=A0A0V0R6H6_PSEPJ|nr:hypothetical protein PPERSA_08479 [Pseudocohnilembus persalinus]|eukprot:KRX10076.1 hypothetical protein PPERSA_08479 [Pseudocohnilembus persalinus]
MQHKNSLKEKKIYEQVFRKYLQHPQYLEEDIFNNMIYAKINDEIISHFLNHEKLKYNNLTGYNLNLFSIKFDLKNFKDSQNYSQHKSILQQILYKIFQNLSKTVTTLKLYLDKKLTRT